MAHQESEEKKTNDQQRNESYVEEQESAAEHTDQPTEASSETENTEAEAEVRNETSDKMAALEQEVSASKDKYLRLYAEFENFRRRTAKERLELTKTANEKLLSELIPVVDDFERSMKAFQENQEAASTYEGIKLVHNKFTKVLEQQGVKSMNVKPGDAFDAEYHEAIVQTPAPNESLKGKIVDVIEQGYFLGERVLRFAKVVTGS